MACRANPCRVHPASALFLALLLASGCSSWKTLQPISPSAYAEAGPASQMRVELTDGRVVTVHSPRMDSDTLRGLCTNKSIAKSAVFSDNNPKDSCAVSLRDVRTAKLKRANALGTTLLIGIPIALFLGACASFAGQD